MYIAMWLDVNADGILDKAKSKRKEIESLIENYLNLKVKLARFKGIDDEMKALNKYLSDAPKILKSEKLLDSLEILKSEANKILDDKLKEYDNVNQQIEQLEKTTLFDNLDSIYYKLKSNRLRDKGLYELDSILEDAFSYINMLIGQDQICDASLYQYENHNYAICALLSLLTGVDIYLISVDGESQFNAYKFMDGDINPDEYYLSFIDILRNNL